MRKLLPPLLVVLLCACGGEPSSPPTPRILSISPSEQFTLQPQLVTVQLDTEPRFLVDYGKRSARMLEQPTLQVGPQSVPLDVYLGHGQFQGTVAAGMDAGRYDIRVSLGDGREATLPDAYVVKPPVVQPSVSYWVESIGPQLQSQPFTVTFHVTGQDAQRYEGSVMVTIYKGSSPILSRRSGNFAGGLLREQFTIDSSGNNFLVVVKDDQGETATSNSFRVDPNI